MPNWCEGNLRIRGTKKNIENFLKNEIVYVVQDKNEFGNYIEKTPNFEEVEHYLTIYDYNAHDAYYIRNTRRNFFFTNQIEIYWPDEEDNGETIIVLDNYNVAWSFKEQGWAEHATRYNLDFRMFGFERGGQFSQIMTVARNGDLNIETKEYNDWNWECPFPNMGG